MPRIKIDTRIIMPKIVNLQNYRAKALEQRSYGAWQKRFGESYGIHTKLSDLSDKTLYYLALPGDNSTNAFYEFIMGVLGLGAFSKFHYLENITQLMVVDIHLFLADQIRFELMRRLTWLQGFPTEDNALLEMVQQRDALKAKCKENPPVLAESHPQYDDYQQRTRGDKEVFIRRLLQQALDVFKKRLEE
jgi:hypothetical protein